MKQCSVCFFIVFIGLNFSFGHRSNTPTELDGQLLGSEQAVVLATSVGYHPEIIPKNYAQYPKEHVQPKPNKNHLMVVQSIAPPIVGISMGEIKVTAPIENPLNSNSVVPQNNQNGSSLNW